MQVRCTARGRRTTSTFLTDVSAAGCKRGLGSAAALPCQCARSGGQTVDRGPPCNHTDENASGPTQCEPYDTLGRQERSARRQPEVKDDGRPSVAKADQQAQREAGHSEQRPGAGDCPDNHPTAFKQIRNYGEVVSLNLCNC